MKTRLWIFLVCSTSILTMGWYLDIAMERRIDSVFYSGFALAFHWWVAEGVTDRIIAWIHRATAPKKPIN